MSSHDQKSLKVRLLRFVIGLVLVVGFYTFLAAAPIPGFFGEFLQRNVDEDIEVTALFYADLEDYYDIEERLETPELLDHLQYSDADAKADVR